jgi:hypothetical protein
MAAGPNRIVAVIDKIKPMHDLRIKIIQHLPQKRGGSANGTPEGEQVAAVKGRLRTKVACAGSFHERKERHFVPAAFEPLNPAHGMDAASVGYHSDTERRSHTSLFRTQL